MGRKLVIPQEDEGCTRMTDVLASYVVRMEKTPLRGSTPLSPEPVAADIGEEAAGHGFYTRTKKPPAVAFHSLPQELTDIVKICTKASRANFGDLVWLTWDGGKGVRKDGNRVAHPMHGSTLVGVTVSGTQGMQRCWAQVDSLCSKSR